MGEYRVVSDNRQSKLKNVQIEGSFDRYNLPEMRKTVSRVVARFLRKKIPGHLSVQETLNGQTRCIAIVSVTFPKYDA